MRSWRLRRLLVFSSFFASLAWGSGAAALGTFTALPGPGIGSFSSSSASGISADGSTVVGSGYHPTTGFPAEAYRWTTSSGAGMGLGILAGDFGSHARAVSADGSSVVGTSYRSSPITRNEAFRWTSGGGMVGLGDLPGGSFNSSAQGISADGSTVVGSGQSGNPGVTRTEAYRWTSGGGMVALVDLGGGHVYGSSASGISADGSIIVGSSMSQAVIWTSGGIIGLGDLPGGSFSSYARNVSADGSTVVGVGHGAAGEEAFRWTSSSGMIGLGLLPGGIRSTANDVSADGSIVVGDVVFPTQPEQTTQAFIWDATHGMRDLKTALTDFGLGPALNGWTLTSVTGISDDGLTIAGSGGSPTGYARAWVAMIPEPGTGLLVATGLLGLAGWRRARA